MPAVEEKSAEKCPVDHESRQKWLQGAASARNSELKRRNPGNDTTTPGIPVALLHRHGATRYSLDTGRWEADTSKFVLLHAAPSTSSNSLPTDREISTIPRSHDNDPQHATLNSAERAALPANSERDTGHDRTSGNWIYPSQDMFFNAMKRKGHDPQATDMATIVPIHNAVNERAWNEIKKWEAGRGAETCGGPRLTSFSGDSTKLSPRAWWKSLVGYQKPFDRHDWVVDRCGKRVEYIIDFYSGKDEGVMGKALNFHLDVRPKLNTWGGITTRMSRAVGM